MYLVFANVLASCSADVATDIMDLLYVEPPVEREH